MAGDRESRRNEFIKRAEAKGKKIIFEKPGKAKAGKKDKTEKFDIDLADESIMDAISVVKNPAIKSCLEKFLKNGTLQQKKEFCCHEEGEYHFPPEFNKHPTKDNIVCEVVCFTVCFHTGGGALHPLPGGSEGLSDKCYERCHKVCT
jgi:hypothetical protein